MLYAVRRRLLDPVEHEVGGELQRALVGRARQLLRQARRLRAVLARQEARLLQAARRVHQLVRLLHVARLLEPPHDHRVQLGVLPEPHTYINKPIYLGENKKFS